MIKLLVSGDSWTSCWPLEQRLGHRDFGWPNLVAKHFGFDLVDLSRAGSSNDRIYRKAFDGMISGTDIAIVFLTHWTRFECGATYGNKPGRIYQHLAAEPTSQEAFRLFFNGYLTYTNLLRQILSLQCISQQYQCPCYFLDTFHNNLYMDISQEDFKEILQYNMAVFDNMSDARILDKFRVVKNLERKINWDFFISHQSYQELIKDCKLEQEHPIEDGHATIANIVIDFLESKKHGQTL